MSAVLAIARREVRERRFLLAAAATLSLLAWILQGFVTPAWTRGLGESLALVLFMAFPTAVALAVGSSLIGRDLALGRLSFYFSRPLSSAALWAGKFLGGAALVLGTFFCCVIPFVLSTGGIAREAAAGWSVLLLGLMAFAHVTTAMYRSGSWLFALDLGLGALFVTVFGAQLRHLVSAGAGRLLFEFGQFQPFGGVLGAAAILATAGMLAAAAAQLAHGRADAHRGHVALSTVVWTLALAGFGGLALWSTWVLRVTPADVGGVGHPPFAAPRGRALFFKGSGRGRAGFSPIFLMNGQSGSYVRLPPERVTPPAFAVDGSMAVWVAPAATWWEAFNPNPVAAFGIGVELLAVPDSARADPWYPELTLMVARLDRGGPVIEERPIELLDAVSIALAVDAHGEQALLSGRSSVFLVDAASGKLLAGLALSDVAAADFLADGSVRLYRLETRPRATFVVLDWNAKDGSQIERARVPGEGRMMLLARRGDLAVVSTGVREKAIVDAASGAVRSFDSGFSGAALVLSTGQVALSLDDEVRVVARGGETVASLPVGSGTRVYALCEPAPGELAVGLWTRSLAGRRTIFLDATTGVVRREEEDLLPAGSGHAGTGPSPEAGSLASRLFTDSDGRLIALEPDGRRREIVTSAE